MSAPAGGISSVRPDKIALAPIPSAVSAIEQAWQARQLYGSHHPASMQAFTAAAQSWDAVCESPNSLTLRVVDGGLWTTDGETRTGGLAPGVHAALESANVLALEIASTPRATDIAEFFDRVSSSAEAMRAGRSPDVPRQIGPIRVTSLSLATLETCEQTGAPAEISCGGAGHDAIVWAIHDGASGPETAAMLARLLRQDTSGAASTPARLAELTRQLRTQSTSDTGLGTGGVPQLRHAIKLLSPELRSAVCGLNGASSAPRVEDLAELVDVVPVHDACTALLAIEGEGEHVSPATIRLVRRLAGMAAEDADDLLRVADTAAAWAERAEGSATGEAFASLADLCRETSRADFIPADYEARLDRIATGLVELATDQIDTSDSETIGAVHTLEILLHLTSLDVAGDRSDDWLMHESVPDDIRGVDVPFAGVGPLLVHAARAGRVDLIERTLDISAGLASRGNHVAADTSRTASGLTLIAEAIARCKSADVLATHGQSLAARARAPIGDIAAEVLTRRPTAAARAFAQAQLCEGVDRGDEATIARLVREHPSTCASLVELFNRMEPERAWGLITTALNAADDSADAEVFGAAARFTHAWPVSLVERGLRSSASAARLTTLERVRTREHALGGVIARVLANAASFLAHSPSEQDVWIRVLVDTDRQAGTHFASRALRHAAWRATRWHGGLVQGIGDSLRATGNLCWLDRVLTTMSPARCAVLAPSRKKELSREEAAHEL